MNRPVTFEIFVEDRAHEEFLVPLVLRIASDEGIRARTRVRSARGGHGRAIQEFRLYQDLLKKGIFLDELPDLLVVAIDGNCSTFAKKRKEILDEASGELVNRIVAACPDPHVERWYLADPDSFHSVVGTRPIVGKRKCARDYYKNILTKAVRDAGHPITLGGIEFAKELAEGMDLYRASRNDHSFNAFVADLRSKIRFARSL